MNQNIVAELYSFLPYIVASALLGFSALFGRKALKQQSIGQQKWNEYIR